MIRILGKGIFNGGEDPAFYITNPSAEIEAHTISSNDSPAIVVHTGATSDTDLIKITAEYIIGSNEEQPTGS